MKTETIYGNLYLVVHKEGTMVGGPELKGYNT